MHGAIRAERLTESFKRRPSNWIDEEKGHIYGLAGLNLDNHTSTPTPNYGRYWKTEFIKY